MKKILCLALMMVFALAGCGGAGNGGAATIDYRGDLKEQPVVSLPQNFSRGINDFGFASAASLYSADENLAISPVSIELALAMTRTGAAGDTAEEMKNTLALSALSDEQIIEACRSLMWRANTGGMEAANSIWLGKRYTYSEEFLNTCTNDFMADAYPLEIPGAMEDINGWVNEKTHGKINKLLAQEPDPLTEMILCNALYYLGDWEIPFEANDTYDEDFNSPEGAITASFMHSDWSVPYYENDTYSMISLKFKSKQGEGKYAMALLLPAKGKDIPELLASLDGDNFAAALSGLSEEQVQIKLPKFEYMFFSSLSDMLIDMGMQSAFDVETADFSGLTDEQNDIFISEVLHKCYIRVDELGAEAAAVTIVEAPTSAAPIENPTTFYADRPFLFAIYSQEDGTIAFMGVVNDPTK